MFGDENDFKYQMEIESAKHMEVTPDIGAIHAPEANNSLYDSRNGFSDVEVLSSFKGFTEEIPVADNSQDSVSEFIAHSESPIQFNNMGEPIQHQVAEHHHIESLPTHLEAISAETLAMFDQEDNR